jgi:spermidine synthase
MTLDKNWYTEKWQGQGAAISLHINDKIHDELSDYQHIKIYNTESFGRLMTLDGLVMVTDRDNFIYHEMMTHPAILAHPAPEKVLIIGGGDCGTLREVLKHKNISQADQVELDERVTRVAEKYFPNLCSSNSDTRANLIFDDGIKWVQNTTPANYDLIIIDSTDPVGPAAGLFEHEFYGACHAALTDNGILVAQSESPLFHGDLIKSMRQEMNTAGFDNVTTLLFPQCTYPSGWWSATLASKEILKEPREREIETFYYSTEIHKSAQALPPFLKQTLEN